MGYLSSYIKNEFFKFLDFLLRETKNYGVSFSGITLRTQSDRF